MMISINNSVSSTYIFIILLLALVLIRASRRERGGFFPLQATQELKGLAILAIIFSHIGYFLVADHSFLFPLSVLAGVGVNLFLFLSGYGLTVSSIMKRLSPGQFYQRRLTKLFLPLWLALVILFLLDYFALNLAYGPAYIGRSFLGFFPRADLYGDVNSPLWYFTFILFYYLLFPLVSAFKNHRWSALAVYLITYTIVWLDPNWLSQVRSLYKIHLLAFPLGMLFASLYYEPNSLTNFFRARRLPPLKPFWLERVAYWALVAGLLAGFSYTAYYSNIGGGSKEELTSLITMFALIILFLIKKVNFGFFYIFGAYSYEIYLLHWPILYRYEMFYRFMPAWLATALYLILFLIFGLALKKISDLVLKFLSRKQIIN